MKPTQDQINKWLHDSGSVTGHGDLLMISHETLRRFAELAMREQAEVDSRIAFMSHGREHAAAAIRASAPKTVPQK